MPDFDDSFLSYCERTERKRKHSYNFNSARNSSVGGSSFSIEKGGHQQNGGSRGNLLATAKSYSKTLPRSFRKNLQKISQFIRDSDGDLHFYDLNHNEVPAAAEVVGATSASWKTERVTSRSRKSDKVISIVDFERFGNPPPQVELLANRSLDEEKCLDQSVLVDDENVVEEEEEVVVASACDNAEEGGVENEEGKYEDGKEAAEAAGGGEENNSK